MRDSYGVNFLYVGFFPSLSFYVSRSLANIQCEFYKVITKSSEHSCKILFEMGALLHITLCGLNRLHKKTGYNAILI